MSVFIDSADAVNELSRTTIVMVVVTAIVISMLITRFSSSSKKKKGLSSISPPEIPSFLPFLGSAIELSRLGFGTMAQKYSAQFDNAPIVTAHVAGRTFHLIAEPAAVSALFRYGEDYLSMGPAIRDFSKSFFGMSSKGLSIFDSAVRKEYNTRFVSKHLLHPTGLERVITTSQDVLSHQLSSVIGQQQQESTTTSMDLYTLVKKVMFAATLQSVIFSPSNNNNPMSEKEFNEFVEAYILFDSSLEVAFAGLPLRFFARDAFHAREKLIRFFQSDNSFVPSAFLKERVEKMQAVGMSKDDIARDSLLWVWGACTNFITSQFWMVYYIALDQGAQEAARKEVAEILAERQKSTTNNNDDDEKEGHFTKAELDKMVVLESMFKEMTRVIMTNIIMREVMQDFEMDLKLQQKPSQKYFLKKGTNLIFYPPILHHDEHVFKDPEVYQWDRFLPKEDTNKSNTFVTKTGEVISEPLKNFGGGAHYCPGRRYAEQAAKSFVATLLQKYNLSLSGTAEVSKSRDGLGFLHPKNKVDLILEARS